MPEDFTTHLLAAFYARTNWQTDNAYTALTATATNLLDFSIPSGVRLNVSALASPNFASSYALATKGLVDGSLSFLYSSQSLYDLRAGTPPSGAVSPGPWRSGYRQLLDSPQSLPPVSSTILANGSSPKSTLLFGRLYLPTRHLEALYLRRISPTTQLKLSLLSLPDSRGTLLALLQNDHVRYSTEYLYSTDSSLIGVRGLYNFRTPTPTDATASSSSPSAKPSTTADLPPALSAPPSQQNGRLSAGAEAYFSPVNKSGGLSTGLRFATLPSHPGFPYTMTLTLNPLMGNLSSTYAVRAGRTWSLCSRFDFNVYSYESDVVLGCELWRLRKQGVGEGDAGVGWARKMLREGWEGPTLGKENSGGGLVGWEQGEVEGVLRARCNDKGGVGVVWESRVKDLMVSFGAGLDLGRRERVVGRVGCEVAYAS